MLVWKALVLEMGMQTHPKSFDLLKIWAKYLKIRVKIAPNVVWFQKWHSRFAEKHMKTCVWRSHEKMVFWSFWEKICKQKLHKKLFGPVWGNSGKNISHSKKFVCSYIYDEKAPAPPLHPFEMEEGEMLPSCLLSPAYLCILLYTLFTRCCKLQCVTRPVTREDAGGIRLPCKPFLPPWKNLLGIAENYWT